MATSMSAIRNELEGISSRERESGVFLSVLGFGGGNYNDLMMRRSPSPATARPRTSTRSTRPRRSWSTTPVGDAVHDRQGREVPGRVQPGKGRRIPPDWLRDPALNREDFNNDKVDAGEIGAGPSVTAIYEFTPVGGPLSADLVLRYPRDKVNAGKQTDAGDEVAFVKVRYKLPGGDSLDADPERPVTEADTSDGARRSAGGDPRFALAVAAYGQKLRDADQIARLRLRQDHRDCHCRARLRSVWV